MTNLQRNFYPRPPGGGRRARLDIPVRLADISIHALRVEGDSRRPLWAAVLDYFYPRPPGGGRPHADARPKGATNFYPRPPGGGRHGFKSCYLHQTQISIHALRVEGDLVPESWQREAAQFLSTPSGWRATACRLSFRISSGHFYPRPPGGGRPARTTRATLDRR